MPDTAIYELLLRRAFGQRLGHEMKKRWGDPAALADAGYIETSDEALFVRAKSAAVYAMSIIANRIEEKDGSLGMKDELFDKLVLQVFNARDSLTAINAIFEFQDQIEFKTFPPENR